MLFKQLVGTNVLGVEGSTQSGRTTRVYAFCSRSTKGAVVVLALNIADTLATFTLQSGFKMYPRQEYRLTAPNGDLSSAQVELNGVVLEASSSGALPAFNPVNVDSNIPVTVAATSFSFIVFPEANAQACQ